MKKDLRLTRRGLYPLFFLLVLLGQTISSFGQAKDSRGKDFWVMFNANLSVPTITVFITSDVNTTGTVSIPGMGFSTNFTVTANTVTPVVLPTAVSQHTNNVKDNKGVHITSVEEVTVYGLNYAPFTTDAFLSLPTDVLGLEYIVLTYGGLAARSSFGVVATQNNTTVTITPAVAAGGRAANVPYTLTMNQGETYELRGGTDMSGTRITSDKPIGVMGSSECANIPPNAAYCDHIVEMIPPLETYGRTFATVPLKSRTNGDTWRLLASEDNTVIRINGVAEPAINKGQWREKIITSASVIQSDKPIMIAQYSNGSSFSGNPGDPFMMLIPSLEQFLGKYTVTTVSGYVAHYINIVAPTSVVGSLMLDGAAVPASEFTAIGSSGFSGAQIKVEPGTHNLSATLPFGVFQYGFNQDDSYGYPGGQSFSAVAIVNSLVLTPETGSGQVGTEHCLNARVRDQFNNPLEGIRVDFNITGANPGSSGFAFTNANGIAEFCYTGANSGTDNIVASTGATSDNASFIWNAVQSNVYYSKAAGNLHMVGTWGVNPDGSGANPPDFGAGKTFMLANRAGHLYTMTANWTVGGTLNIPATGRLRINGHTLSIAHLTGPGSLYGSATSNLVVTGDMGGDVGMLRFVNGGRMLNNLTLNRTGANASATVATPLDILGVLTVSNGQLKTGNNITLKSSLAATARVAPVMGSIVGSVTVERYIPARRAWRLMNAPVKGNQTINQAWQEGATTASANPNPAPGYGTHITNTTTALGFDINPGATPSLKWYNSAIDNLQNVPNTINFKVGERPWFIFVRGNRGLKMGTKFVAPNITTLRAKGELNVGDQTFPVSKTGFTAIPNPFASPIDYATITRNGVQNNFYLWDPKMGGANGVGAYVNISFNGVGYDVTPASVSPESQIIQSGQSFLVKAEAGAANPSLVIKESDKSPTAATNVFRARLNGEASELQAPENTHGLRINLQSAESSENTSVLDEVYASYNSRYSNSIDEMDARKLENMEENLAIVRGSDRLMVERRGAIAESDTLFLNVWNTSATNYVLEFSPVNLTAQGLYATLVDKYRNTYTDINTKETSQIFYSINGDAGSSDPNRFFVIISPRRPSQPVADLSRQLIHAYPNPVIGKQINLQLNDAAQGVYHVELVNSIGQIVYRKELRHGGGYQLHQLNLNTTLSKGVYQLHLRGENTRTTLKLVSQ